MNSRPIHVTPTILLLAAGLLLIAPEPASGERRSRPHGSRFYYSSPANILRGQLALERLGHLERGRVTAGRLDAATREALRDFQWAHSIRVSGRLDRDTFAMLPIDGRPDRDDDGVPDADDRCRSTERGARVDFSGCPPADPSSSDPE